MGGGKVVKILMYNYIFKHLNTCRLQYKFIIWPGCLITMANEWLQLVEVKYQVDPSSRVSAARFCLMATYTYYDIHSDLGWAAGEL